MSSPAWSAAPTRPSPTALSLIHICLLEGYWQDALFSLRDLPNVVDIRAVGLVGGVQLAPHADGPGKRGYDVFERCFWEHDLMVRVTGDIIAMSPPLIIDKPHIDQIVERLAQAIRASV